MTAESGPAPRKLNKTALIVILSILGVVILCTVMNAIGNNANSVPPTPPEEQTSEWATALAHVAAVATKWRDVTPAAALPTWDLPTVGDRVDRKSYALTVTNVETAMQYGDRKAQAGNKFVAVTVLFESKAYGGVYIGPDDFELQDSDARLYRTTRGKDPSFQIPITLPKDKKMTCLVSFEVLEDAHDLLLNFSPGMLPNETPISIRLGL
jgi:hypothetical protein